MDEREEKTKENNSVEELKTQSEVSVEEKSEEPGKTEEKPVESNEEEKNLEEAKVAVEKLDRRDRRREEAEFSIEAWIPKTKMGVLVKTGKEKDLDNILINGKKILEPEIVDALMQVESDLLLIGQAKGKFGGGKRRAWRQTQKKTQEGNVLTFSSMAVVGDRKGHVGVGYGKAKETLPARGKAVRNAKLNLIRIERGFESPELESGEGDPHTVPFKTQGKCGSVRITLVPAPRGTGLVIGDECKKILRLAGIKDVYSRTEGNTKTTFNVAKACIHALRNTTQREGVK